MVPRVKHGYFKVKLVKLGVKSPILIKWYENTRSGLVEGGRYQGKIGKNL